MEIARVLMSVVAQILKFLANLRSLFKLQQVLAYIGVGGSVDALEAIDVLRDL